MRDNLMYADMSQPSQRIFSPLTLSILKTITNLQKFSVQSCHHRHWGAALSTSATLKTAISHIVKRIY